MNKIMRVLLIGLFVSALIGCSANNSSEGISGSSSDKSSKIQTTDRTNTENSTNNFADNTKNNESVNIPEPSNTEIITNSITEKNFDEILESANASGSVIDFWDDGCSVSMSQVDEVDGGAIAYEAASGYETEDTTLYIKYEKNCIFQIATINVTTGQYTLRDASISDLKKQSSLVVYGNFDDEHNLTASRIIITRYE